MTRRATARDPIDSDFIARLETARQKRDAESRGLEAIPPKDTPPSQQPPPSQYLPPRQIIPDPLVEPPPSQQPGGYSFITHDVTDRILRTFDPYSQIVLVQLIRLTWGFHQTECVIGLPKLAERCGFSIDKVRDAKKKLIARGIVADLGDDYTNANNALRGTRYRMLLSAPPLKIRPPGYQQGGSQQPAIKDKALKETIKLCSRCEATNGFVYVDEDRSKGVRRCDHQL